MYVVKVGEYYVKDIRAGEYVLSREVMRDFPKNMADIIAKVLNGEVIEITEEVTND
jgi:hypothetical protein